MISDAGCAGYLGPRGRFPECKTTSRTRCSRARTGSSTRSAERSRTLAWCVRDAGPWAATVAEVGPHHIGTADRDPPIIG